MYGKDFLFENHLGKIGDDFGRYVNTLSAADSLIKAMFFKVIKDDGVIFKEGEELFMIEQDGKTVSDFKIPKEQFDYFLRTKKQFITQNADSLGIVIKKFSFKWNVPYRLMQVGTKDNLISYFELVEFYKGKFNAESWEIDLWIYLSLEEELKTLKDEVDDEGYVRFDEGNVEVFGKSSNSAKYTLSFFFKPQAEKLNPERYLDFQTLAGLWKKKFSIDEDKIVNLISGNLTFFSLFRRDLFDIGDINISCPINKEKHTFLCDDASYEEKVKFIKEAAFGASYIKAIEDKYFRNLQKKSNRGRKPEFDESAVWKVFVESLDGKFDESKSDFAQQAYDAYCELDDIKKKNLAFVQKESVTKQNIITYLLEKTENKMGGKTNLDKNIATPFAEKFPKNSRL